MGNVFIATLGVGKGTWGHVGRLISEEDWDRIILISNEWGKENFTPAKEVDWVIINVNAGFEVLKNTIKEQLPSGDLCVNVTSGSGKEHMALLAALRESNSNFKVVTLTGEGTKYY